MSLSYSGVGNDTMWNIWFKIISILGIWYRPRYKVQYEGEVGRYPDVSNRS